VNLSASEADALALVACDMFGLPSVRQCYYITNPWLMPDPDHYFLCLTERIGDGSYKQDLFNLVTNGPRNNYWPTTLEALAALSILNDTIWKEKPHVPRTEEEA
jgi:hypothetical protein